MDAPLLDARCGPLRRRRWADQADFLGALERWRESGTAPNQIVATRGAGRGGQPAMTRPLCPFPQVEKYRGRETRTTLRTSSAPLRERHRS